MHFCLLSHRLFISWFSLAFSFPFSPSASMFPKAPKSSCVTFLLSHISSSPLSINILSKKSRKGQSSGEAIVQVPRKMHWALQIPAGWGMEQALKVVCLSEVHVQKGQKIRTSPDVSLPLVLYMILGKSLPFLKLSVYKGGR